MAIKEDWDENEPGIGKKDRASSMVHSVYRRTVNKRKEPDERRTEKRE